jgi:hypothetical protein
MAMSREDETMRRRDAVLGGLIWVTLALAMPVVALEPVQAVARQMGPESLLKAGAACADGSASLIMGCASIHL